MQWKRIKGEILAENLVRYNLSHCCSTCVALRDLWDIFFLPASPHNDCIKNDFLYGRGMAKCCVAFLRAFVCLLIYVALLTDWRHFLRMACVCFLNVSSMMPFTLKDMDSGWQARVLVCVIFFLKLLTDPSKLPSVSVSHQNQEQCVHFGGLFSS